MLRIYHYNLLYLVVLWLVPVTFSGYITELWNILTVYITDPCDILTVYITDPYDILYVHY